MKASLIAASFVAANVLSHSSSEANNVTTIGSFEGASDHITTGGVAVVKTGNGGAVVIFDTNFFMDGSPDPRVGFGRDGQFAGASDLGALTKNTGLQVFVVPLGVNVDDFNEVYVWSKKFARPLGVAALK